MPVFQYSVRHGCPHNKLVNCCRQFETLRGPTTGAVRCTVVCLLASASCFFPLILNRLVQARHDVVIVAGAVSLRSSSLAGSDCDVVRVDLGVAAECAWDFALDVRRPVRRLGSRRRLIWARLLNPFTPLMPRTALWARRKLPAWPARITHPRLTTTVVFTQGSGEGELEFNDSHRVAMTLGI